MTIVCNRISNTIARYVIALTYLGRYFKQYESIVRVEQEQKILLEKLANNEL
jgi:hypothetical protein